MESVALKLDESEPMENAVAGYIVGMEIVRSARNLRCWHREERLWETVLRSDSSLAYLSRVDTLQMTTRPMSLRLQDLQTWEIVAMQHFLAHMSSIRYYYPCCSFSRCGYTTFVRTDACIAASKVWVPFTCIV